jgi:hypothetical protein
VERSKSTPRERKSAIADDACVLRMTITFVSFEGVSTFVTLPLRASWQQAKDRDAIRRADIDLAIGYQRSDEFIVRELVAAVFRLI